MERIKSRIEKLLDVWKWHSSTEAKYRCEVYKELLEYINSLQEEPVSNDLEEAAKKAGQKYFPDKDNIWARPNYEAMAAENAFKEGVEWQEEQCQKTIELAEDHAYLAGQEKAIEKACEFLKKNLFKVANDLTDKEDKDRFIREFRKAMEE